MGTVAVDTPRCLCLLSTPHNWTSSAVTARMQAPQNRARSSYTLQRSLGRSGRDPPASRYLNRTAALRTSHSTVRSPATCADGALLRALCCSHALRLQGGKAIGGRKAPAGASYGCEVDGQSLALHTAADQRHCAATSLEPATPVPQHRGCRKEAPCITAPPFHSE